MTEHILKFFPRGKKPRSVQSIILDEAISALKDPEVTSIVIEAPVGTGKSAIALTLANAFGGAHILTPQKRLQTQYEEDFTGEMVGMRGRSYYPCKVDNRRTTAACPLKPTFNASKEEKSEYMVCRDTVCPYTLALRTAQEHNVVVHNYHSFIFQAAKHGRFLEKPLLIFDEAHELSGIVRDFVSYSRNINAGSLPDALSPAMYDGVELDVDQIIALEMAVYENIKADLTPKEEEDLLADITNLVEKKEYLTKDNAVIHSTYNTSSNRLEISITPINVASACRSLLYEFGNKKVFMSGTIFNFEQFCNETGLQKSQTRFIRSGTSFRKENRPIYLKREYQVDTSHRMWDDNFEEMIDKIGKVLDKFHDAKGLIHSPSYRATGQIMAALSDMGRLVTHKSSEDVEESLNAFYQSTDPLVFISPSCYQGVDMKYDRAVFQIIVRVPYPNMGDPFVSAMAALSQSWYNHQTLVTFGQQLGRIVRAEDDFGVTILLDSRFRSFLSRVKKYIPKWLEESFIHS